MIPKLIHQTARSKDLSWEEQSLLRRTMGTLSSWDYKLWDDADNESLVKDYYPEFYEKFSSISRGVVKADICRCMYMDVFGGFYIDTDYLFYKEPSHSLLSQTCILPLSRQSEGDDSGLRLGNAVFGSIKGHPFWKAFLRHLFAQDLAIIPEDMIEKVTGPEGLTVFFASNRDLFKDVLLAPRSIFHPEVSNLGWRINAKEDTIGVHMCWGSWRSKGAIGYVHAVSRKLRSLTIR